MIVSLRDVWESGWHLSLLALAWPPVLRAMLRDLRLRVLLAAMVVIAFGYHVVVLERCHRGAC